MPNIIDAAICVIALIAAIVSTRRGTIKQIGGLIGIVGGIFTAAYVYSHLAFLTENSTLKAVILIALLCAVTYLFHDIISILAGKIQNLPFLKKFVRSIPERIGSICVTSLNSIIAVWLFASLVGALLPGNVQALVAQSAILNKVSETAKPPEFIAKVGQLLQPFTAPDIFAESEPTLNTSIEAHPGSLDNATARAQSSVVKINTWGCGSLGSGSGFIVSKNTVLTNAHVVAGADRASIQDQTGNTFVARAVWFDPLLDIALLAIETPFSTPALEVTTEHLNPGTPGRVMGFPGGGAFAISDATILGSIDAEGYDIYQKQKTIRKLYAIRSDIVPGNSGGPLIDGGGKVAGVIIGHSTTQNRTGYAITGDQVMGALKTHDPNATVGMGSCVGA